MCLKNMVNVHCNFMIKKWEGWSKRWNIANQLNLLTFSESLFPVFRIFRGKIKTKVINLMFFLEVFTSHHSLKLKPDLSNHDCTFTENIVAFLQLRKIGLTFDWFKPQTS